MLAAAFPMCWWGATAAVLAVVTLVVSGMAAMKPPPKPDPTPKYR